MKSLFGNWYLLLVCSLSLLSPAILASEAAYVPAVFVKNSNPMVEETYDRNDQEGWTYMNYVIDESGNVQSPLILDHSENSKFLADSLSYISGLKYQPATLNGKPVPSNQFLFLQHTINSGRDLNKSAGTRFAEHYGEALKLIANNKLDESQAAINGLKEDFTKNLARKSWIAWLSAMLNFRQQDYDNYLRNLVIASSLAEDYLSNKVVAKLYMNLFEMQMYANRYVDASLTLNKMKDSEKVTVDDDLYKSLLERVTQQLAGESAFSVKIAMMGDKWQYYRVHRPQLHLNWQAGTLSGLKLRCPASVNDYLQNIDSERQSMTLETVEKDCVLLVQGRRGSQLNIKVDALVGNSQK